MAQRMVALCKGQFIGIETIYTVINGRQINIPDKLKYLREKSRRNELFCPCGCGRNLILVAGDKNLREQHFRETERKPEFTFLSEAKKLAVRYWKTRADIADDKLDVLTDNLSGIDVIYIVDGSNGGTQGQYPEALMKL